MAERDTIEDRMDDKMKLRQLAVEFLKPEFEKFLNPLEILDYTPSLADSDKEAIKQLEAKSRREAISKLIDIVVGSSALLNEFIVALERKGYKRLYNKVHQDQLPGTSEQQNVYPTEDSNLTGEQFEFLIKLLSGELISLILPSEIMPWLMSSECLNDEDHDAISTKETSNGQHAACREMFDLLPRRKKNWAMLFIDALQKSHRHVIKKLDPNETYEDDSDTDLKKDAAKKLYCDPDDQEMSDPHGSATITEAVVMTEGAASVDELKSGAPKSSKDDQDSGKDCDPLFSDDDDQDVEEKNPSLKLREYQLELAEAALEGKNTIICAGTGSGKTRVAVHIIQKHMEKFDKAKVVFFARTVPLVGQQYKAIQKFLPRYKVGQFAGGFDNSNCLHQLLDDYDIIVLTPQLLENQLEEGKISSISVFSLLVFDECHHTQKREPYNCIMIRYLKLKYDKLKGYKLPQVVGLTASIGVAKATTDEEACDSILKVCANLDIPYISTVEKHEEEYKKYVATPEEKAFLLKDRSYDPVKDVLENFMEKVEDMLRNSDVMFEAAVRSLLLRIPDDRGSQEYYTWTVDLDKFVKVNIENERLFRSTLTCNNVLKAFNRALEVNELLRAKDVITHLMKDVTLPQDDRQTDTDRQINQLFAEVRKKLNLMLRDVRFENPNLVKIRKFLNDCFEKMGDDSRFIIFVRARATAMALAEFVNDKKFECGYLTGTGPSEEEGGMTKVDQDRIIAKLKAGTLKGIVATSVAEEGIDISDCNIIVRYNYVGNEITTVQTKGRSRKKGGKSILLAKQKIFERETMNIVRAAMMLRAIKLIKQMNHEAVVFQLEQIQQETLKDEDIKDSINQDKTDRKRTEEFSLICGTCSVAAVDGSFIRTIGQHYVVVDPEFLNKISKENLKKCRKYDDINIFAHIKCNKCAVCLGKMMIHKHVHFPVLKIEAFVFKSMLGRKQMYNKWINVPYEVLPILDSHYEAMARINAD